MLRREDAQMGVSVKLTRPLPDRSVGMNTVGTISSTVSTEGLVSIDFQGHPNTTVHLTDLDLASA